MRPRGLSGRSGHQIGRRSTFVGIALVLTMVSWLGLSVVFASTAIAHADFVASDPPHNAVVEAPVVEIEITFTAPVEPREPDIGLTGEDRGAIAITVLQRSPDHLVVQPDAPLTDGVFILRWAAASADGHGIEGVVRFEVLADASTDGEADGQESGQGESASVDTTIPDTINAPPTTVTLVARATAPEATATSSEPTAADAQQTSDGTDLTGLVGAIGRWLGMLGALVAIGATAFTAWALVGTESEIRRIFGWIRAAGIALIIGTVLEVGATAVASAGVDVLLDPIGILDAIPTSLAYASVLRVAGGIALLQSPSLVTRSRYQPQLVGAAVDESPSGSTSPAFDDSRQLIVREEWLLLAGVAAIAVSYLVDGHSAGLGIIGRTANLVHVLAAGVWLGGVLLLGDLTVRRKRSQVPTHLAESTVRFSRIATLALVAVAVAGGLLAWTILDTPADLTSGTWGRLLIGKVVLVVVAAGIGAYNHFRVVPHLEDGRGELDTLGRTLTVEGIALVLVVAVTAALVVAAP